MKCNRRGEKEKKIKWGFGGRDRETRIGFKVPRRNEQLEEKSAPGSVYVCVFSKRVHTHMHLYTDAYSYLVACL